MNCKRAKIENFPKAGEGSPDEPFCDDSEMTAGKLEFVIAGTAVPVSGRPLALEVCCGSAGLSLELAALGWVVFALDKDCLIHSTSITPITADVRHESVRKELLAMAHHPDLKFVHMAPPCGTASRARDRPVAQHLRDRGFPNPPRLRSLDHPLGLPDLDRLHPRQHLHVLAANEVYSFCSAFAKALQAEKISWTIENPANSYYWHIPCVVEPLDAETEDIYMDLCMFGGKRLKHTRLRAHPRGRFGSLARRHFGYH